MKSFLIEIVVLYSLFFASASAAERSLTVTHYPEAVYKGEQAIFVVDGVAQGRVRASLSGKPIAEAGSVSGQANMAFSITMPGPLILVDGSGASRTFLVVSPDGKADLREEDGYLFSGDLPAILLADHDVPSKHDRKWEILKLIKGWFRDSRPTANSGALLATSFLTADVGKSLDSMTATPQGFWLRSPPEPCVYEMHSLVAVAQRLEQRDAALVALSVRDRERGMDDDQFKMKLAWLLQLLEGRGYSEIFILPPALDSSAASAFRRCAMNWLLSHGQTRLVFCVRNVTLPFRPRHGLLMGFGR